MARLRRILGCAALAVWTAGLAPAQKPPKPDPKADKTKKPVEAPPASVPRLEPFAGRFEQAKASAAERNVPLLLHVILEGEEASDRYRDQLIPDPELRAAARGMVVVIANNGQHAQKTLEERGADGQVTKLSVCSVYGTPDCKAHNAHWEAAFREFKREDGVLSCPQAILLAPDGTLALRVDHGDPPPAGTLLGAVQECTAKFGPGLDAAALTRVKALLAEAEAHALARRWPEALLGAQTVLKLAPQGPWARQAREAQPPAERGLAEELARLQARLVPGQAGAAYGELSALARRCTGLPQEKELAARLKQAESERALQPEIAAWKLEQEAEALFAEARQLEAGGKAPQARAAARKLFAPRFAGTQAAAKARSTWPELAAEIDARRAKQ